ncbi:hypothetical protein [Stutzerimonas stutzeri]|uniref:hypothetical protein n=1 Tax=Stutzerimonas stutzeri TaxID=316 RepID=UPI00265D0BCE|nr:hypothetical protein [Stutzerimonas stutzeri]MCF6783712.1 hypothetical protein [Stutzerimonas stutzeri]
MKHDQQESHLRETQHGESTSAMRQLASDPWSFWGIVGYWALVGVAVLYWIGLLEFSPLDFLEWVGSLVSDTQFNEVYQSYFLSGPLAFIRHFVGGLSWAVLVLPWIGYVRYRVGVIEAGSKKAYHQRRREQAKRAAQPAPVGVLVGMSIAKGGFLSSSETLVETSEGFFRVSGLMRTVKKGEPVFKQGGQLLIGSEGAQRRYTVIS